MWAAAAVLLGSAASAAAVALPVPVAPPAAALLVPVPRGPQLPVPVPQQGHLPGPAPPVPLEVPPDLLLNLSSIRLPRVVVGSEVRVHLQGRRSFSAVMARSSRPTGKPT